MRRMRRMPTRRDARTLAAREPTPAFKRERQDRAALGGSGETAASRAAEVSARMLRGRQENPRRALRYSLFPGGGDWRGKMRESEGKWRENRGRISEKKKEKEKERSEPSS
ncbi:hypothetical protein ACJRO7_025769 [Eucalyptus globulus]|uniref:Uncharacterized protein n=1 Tax=Eucalyptus globulus TaxID=34317 RepID=A0ABD3KIJ7_EUCGL